MFLFLLLLSFINPIQCYHWRIPTAIMNAQTVIVCGLSIDIYSTFDPAQVIICPYVWIEKEKIQLISLNICKYLKSWFLFKFLFSNSFR
jgi:hypothetical protein